MTDPTETAETWTFGAFMLDKAERVLRRNGEPVALGPRAFDVLAALLARSGRLVTKDDLLDGVWAGRVVEENNLQVQVSALRKLLGPDAILTIPGRGYRFAMPVERAPNFPGGAGSFGSIDTTHVQPSMFGREEDLAALRREVGQHSLVTLTGAGGIGKTLLAKAVADKLKAEFAGGFVWVDLTPLASETLVASAVALAIGLEPGDGANVSDAVVRALSTTSILLVLDNAEHLVGAVAQLAQKVAHGAPAIRQLVTSQVSLRIPGERVYHLDPLAVPDTRTTLQDATRYPAVTLFAERAKAADRRFMLDAGNIGMVIDICQRLDGIPLALELAAARVPALGLPEIAARLDQRFRLLAQSRRQAPTRQQTLHATFDWSHQLLSDDERSVFRRLGVFVGDFTLQAASSIAADHSLDEWAVIDLLGDLVDRSLVAACNGNEWHYRLTETARAYALEQLRAAGEQEPIARASRFYENAGDVAARRSSHREAVVDYSASLELARLLAASDERDARELALCLKLGPSVQTSGSPGGRECEAIYGRAVALAQRAGTTRDRFLAQWGYWHFLSMAGRAREAAEHADAIVALAPQLDDDGLALQACHASLTTQQLLGYPRAVIQHAERALELYDPVRHRDLRYAFGGHDAGICAASQASIALWLAGLPDRALAMASRALALAQAAQHAYSEAAAYYYTAMTYWACGRTADLTRVANALVDISERYSMESLRTEGWAFRGRAAFEAGTRESGFREMRTALDSIQASGESSFLPFYSSLLVDALIATDELNEAEARLAHAFAATTAGQGFFLPEIYRLRGRLRARRGDREGACNEFASAMRLAREQGSVSLALRAATDIAQQMILSHEIEPAQQLLAAAVTEVYDGSCTPDVKRAHATLELLRARS